MPSLTDRQAFEDLRLRLRLDPAETSLSDEGCLTPMHEAMQWLNEERAHNHVRLQRIPLGRLAEWRLDEQGFLSHREGRFFRFLGLQVTSPNREVTSWHQPIMDNVEPGIIGLLLRSWRGRTHMLMQVHVDVGNRSTALLGPTVQFAPGNYRNGHRSQRPFLFEEFLSGVGFRKLFESRQSEEGGRFYQEDNLHRVLWLPEDRELEPPPSYRWLTFAQVRFFVQLGECVNPCARSILACLA